MATVKQEEKTPKQEAPVLSPSDLKATYDIVAFGSVEDFEAQIKTEENLVLDEIERRFNHCVEGSKPALRRGVNKVRNTTLGTIAEMALLVGPAAYLATREIMGAVEKRKNGEAETIFEG